MGFLVPLTIDMTTKNDPSMRFVVNVTISAIT